MKKLIFALILAVVLSFAVATPVLADDGNGPYNMPEETADHLLDDVRGTWMHTCSLGFGNEQGRGIANWGRGYVGYGVSNNARGVITIIAQQGNPPGQGW